jgi:hypothetical protein
MIEDFFDFVSDVLDYLSEYVLPVAWRCTGIWAVIRLVEHFT